MKNSNALECWENSNEKFSKMLNTGMALVPFILLAVLNFKLYRRIKVLSNNQQVQCNILYRIYYTEYIKQKDKGTK